MQNQITKSNVKDSRARDSGVAIYPCSQEKDYIVKN